MWVWVMVGNCLGPVGLGLGVDYIPVETYEPDFHQWA